MRDKGERNDEGLAMDEELAKHASARMLAWLDEMRKIQQPIFARQGFLPDSTPDIAEDRRSLVETDSANAQLIKVCGGSTGGAMVIITGSDSSLEVTNAIWNGYLRKPSPVG